MLLRTMQTFYFNRIRKLVSLNVFQDTVKSTNNRIPTGVKGY